MKDNNFLENINNNMKSLSLKFLPAIIGTAFLLGNPSESNAARSGGRSGGSSFRSAMPRGGGGGGMRSSTRMYSGSYGPSINVMPMPMYSPFGYGGFGFTPFIPINGNLLLLGGLAYIAYNVISNRLGGSDFSDFGDAGSLGGGATVLKLQVSLDSDWSDYNNIMNTLSNLASKKNTYNGRNELSSLLSEASIALLRRQSSWSAASLESERFRGGNGVERAEPYFQRIAVKERAKFESESNSSQSPLMIAGEGGSKATQAVVSLVVAIRGKSDATRTVTSSRDVSEVLQTLASEALTDDGENIMAVELLWTPSDSGSSLSKRDLIMDYPELIQL